MTDAPQTGSMTAIPEEAHAIPPVGEGIEPKGDADVPGTTRHLDAGEQPPGGLPQQADPLG
ncbi:MULTISPECIES: hypothetical protein [Agrococcus]|uniref:Uncharacterized protein n=1 Tax=Agrococcus pavilionensis RW1 TaxID=1330458 RepID=U1LSU5_9MICO|nr:MULTISPECIES: hypothetical protein [Agrococcus]ERG65177.1 hypothetical protein L332_12105 [Agrococcus pavilionensis RW1]MBO1771089.1 hypothetical protein [Agrococcus sp. TF02-05]QUW18201.1 hypothetical protein JSQ78_10230 [Agrococcus sp. Marseille-Q4369]